MGETCPFGTDVQRYWDKRFEYFLRFNDGIKIDKEGLYSVTPEKIALEIAEHTNGDVIVDAFGGVGGNAIAFARTGKKVYCIELDEDRKSFIEHNAKVYGVDDLIHTIQGDFFAKASTVSAKTVFLDPPWGGPSYKESGSFKLNNFSPDGTKILDYAFLNFDEVVLMVPTIFDFSEIEKFDKQYDLQDNVINGEIISQTIYFS